MGVVRIVHSARLRDSQIPVSQIWSVQRWSFPGSVPRYRRALACGRNHKIVGRKADSRMFWEVGSSSFRCIGSSIFIHSRGTNLDYLWIIFGPCSFSSITPIWSLCRLSPHVWGTPFDIFSWIHTGMFKKVRLLETMDYTGICESQFSFTPGTPIWILSG